MGQLDGAAMTTDDRDMLRTTFDSAAALYQDARPEYPAVLVDELVAITGAGPDGRVLEVGCATGKATLPLAIFGQAHVFPAGGDPFFVDIQDVYDEIGEGVPPGTGRPRPGELPDLRADIEASGLFGDVAVRHFDWEIRYDADGYLRLLDTFSGHIAMAAPKRARLYGEIRRRLAERPDGLLRRHWGSVLQVARRLDAPRFPAGGVLGD